jgi:hypothetical protein
MAGLFDVAKELARLNKQRTKLQKDLDGVNGRLNNPKFMEKASQVGGGKLLPGLPAKPRTARAMLNLKS